MTVIYRCVIIFKNGLPKWLRGKESVCQCRRHKRHGFDPGVGKIPWRRKWQPTAVCFLRNPMNREAWWATGYGVAEFGHDSGTKQQQIFKDKSLIRWLFDCSVEVNHNSFKWAAITFYFFSWMITISWIQDGKREFLLTASINLHWVTRWGMIR